ncbi:YdeI/OmpD-associated family protein [Maribacter sp. MMG018]|uniref:YdeI/OmpD-associated family protein n=1 Tax=Maribacter sp. MMG018 TaxID=2822688 RepID=UPI001B38CBB1|nr:DUF1801 domain-containing protein [Maribacter sp. MMG018]MBQ4914377.1 YdeI/OmpD-associated family protein [Maribacter sp. MMG018]
MEKSEKIEAYYNEEHRYKKAISLLRDRVLKTDLEETFKWSFPTYTLNNKNVLAICKFKNHFGIWFFNGVFLKDPHKVLENAQKGKTKAMRHWKFNGIDEIDKTVLDTYINEAIENQRKGIELTPLKKERTSRPKIPSLLSNAFIDNPDTKQAFNSLTPYKQKEYIEYITSAKQEKTKTSRLAKILPMIIEGRGLNDKYR